MPTVIVVLIVALAATLPIPAFSAGKTPENTTVQRVTLAQIFVTNDVGANMRSIRKAFAQAKKDHASWVLFPEGALSGYTNDFDQREVAKGFEEVQQLCKDTGISTLLGICWKEGDKTLNEIRIVDATGALVGEYAKTCLTYSDAEQFVPGTFPLVHEVNGIRWGTLICNDLWVTPGCSDGPNPHLSLQAAKAGAQVIFHSVNSGADQKYRPYHESNQHLRSSEAKCPFIVVNAARTTPINCTSGIMEGFNYTFKLPRRGEAIRTAEFQPAKGGLLEK